MKHKTLIYILALLLSIILVSGVKPTPQASNVQSGLLEIAYPLKDYFKVNTAFDLYFHIFNGTNGYPLNYQNINCSIHIYNISNSKHLVTTSLAYDANNDFEYKVNDSMFYSLGFYAYIVWCNATNNQSGYLKNGFYITSDGEPEPSSNSVFFIMAIILMPLIIAYLLLKWINDFDGERFAVLRFGVGLFCLTLVFASLWLASLSVVKFFYWSSMLEAISTITYVYGAFYAVILIVLLIIIFKELVDFIANKRTRKREGDE